MVARGNAILESAVTLARALFLLILGTAVGCLSTSISGSIGENQTGSSASGNSGGSLTTGGTSPTGTGGSPPSTGTTGGGTSSGGLASGGTAGPIASLVCSPPILAFGNEPDGGTVSVSVSCYDGSPLPEQISSAFQPSSLPCTAMGPRFLNGDDRRAYFAVGCPNGSHNLAIQTNSGGYDVLFFLTHGDLADGGD
jgi:hypothetical protein